MTILYKVGILGDQIDLSSLRNFASNNASSLLLFTWGFHGAFSVQELTIVIISLILLAIGIFIICYKGKSSSQITAPSTTTTELN